MMKSRIQKTVMKSRIFQPGMLHIFFFCFSWFFMFSYNKINWAESSNIFFLFLDSFDELNLKTFRHPAENLMSSFFFWQIFVRMETLKYWTVIRRIYNRKMHDFNFVINLRLILELSINHIYLYNIYYKRGLL